MSCRLEPVAYEKRYRTIVPILRPVGVDPLTELAGGSEHQDFTIARWLARESFENTVATDRLELVEYSERLLSVGDVNPLLSEQLGRPVGDFEWFEFSGLGRLDQVKFDWFAAEFKWRCDEWLAAERVHLESLDAETFPVGDNGFVFDGGT